MLDQLDPTTEKFTSPTGLRVRQDLYDEDYSDEDYDQMLSMYEGTMASIIEGEIVKSKVLRVTDNAVILDVGFKSEGSVPLDEFKDPHLLKEGDEVEVFLEHLEDQEGAVVLSKFIKGGTVSTVGYNHYSLLRSIEDIFGLHHLGDAQQPQVVSFGPDVYTNK